MTTPETPRDTETLIKNKEDILATKRLFEIHKIDPKLSNGAFLAEEEIIMRNFNYLTKQKRLSTDEYYALFQKCEDAQNFGELALLTYKFLIQKLQQYLTDNPDLPEEGDVITPGKEDIENVIAWNDARLNTMRKKIANQKNILAYEIGGPPLHETPEWILIIKELKIMMSEVYALLEKGNDGKAKEASDAVKDTRDQIDGL